MHITAWGFGECNGGAPDVTRACGAVRYKEAWIDCHRIDY